jgi:hypothetical protein
MVVVRNAAMIHPAGDNSAPGILVISVGASTQGPRSRLGRGQDARSDAGRCQVA